MYCVFDTETTDTDLIFARAVSIAWTVLDKDFKRLASHSFILESDGFEVPKRVIKLHGIDNEKMEKEGVSRTLVLRHFMADIKDCKVLVGHNVMYDFHVVKTELEKLEIPINDLVCKKFTCTMQETMDYCELPKTRKSLFKFKRPNLKELHYKLFKTYFSNAHNAAADVNATAKCFVELKTLKII